MEMYIFTCIHRITKYDRMIFCKLNVIIPYLRFYLITYHGSSLITSIKLIYLL
ncbi:hypothetical protein ACJX0J_037901, partial [Zea mays]